VRCAKVASLSRPELEEALLLLRKAREDAGAVEKLFADVDVADAVVGFHAQQAVEKALKAVLASRGDDFPWTHDLRHLIERLDAVETSLPPQLHEIRVLGPWAVEFRYGETIDDPLDRRLAVALIGETIAWAEAQIGARPD
jgi:HEPN domain-containing protein